MGKKTGKCPDWVLDGGGYRILEILLGLRGKARQNGTEKGKKEEEKKNLFNPCVCIVEMGD